jgi:Predicted GTPase
MFPIISLAATAFTKNQLLDPLAPQLALAGRSNVGKSSLINALAQRKQLAKTSATPGKTRSINYYAIEYPEKLRNGPAPVPVPPQGAALPVATEGVEQGLLSGENALPAVEEAETEFLVDLPGYGYAKCSREERQTWARLLEFYLGNTPGLKALALLLDARLSPQKIDLELVSLAVALRLPLIPVLTKADKCRKKDLEATLSAWQTRLGSQEILVSSAEKKQGIEALWEVFLRTLKTPS